MIESLENRKFKFRQVLNFPSSRSDRQWNRKRTFQLILSVEIRLRVENKREYRDIFPRSIPQSMKDKRKIGKGRVFDGEN